LPGPFPPGLHEKRQASRQGLPAFLALPERKIAPAKLQSTAGEHFLREARQKMGGNLSVAPV